MTQNVQEKVDLMRESIKRSIARRYKRRTKEWCIFEKSFQDLAWHALEWEDEDQKGTKTLLVSMVQGMEQKKATLEDFKVSNYKWP